jgi:GTP-dependent phosphoenolpyruvate carboxykinase
VGSKSAVNVTNGMFVEVIGPQMKTLDDFKIRSVLKSQKQIFQNPSILTPSMVFIWVS